MSCFFEIWLRGYAKDALRALSVRDEEYHPHITFARPFTVDTDDALVRNVVREYGDDTPLLPFTIVGEGSFPQGARYLSVSHDGGLLRFNDGLERVLEPHVSFKKKFDDDVGKVLHAAVYPEGALLPQAPIDQYMLRLTGIKDERVWFSYDFVTREILTREESLDKVRWTQTVARFSEQTGLVPTPNGFVRRVV